MSDSNSVKNVPGSPLPWFRRNDLAPGAFLWSNETGELLRRCSASYPPEDRAKDVDYAAHAATAYPALVTALKDITAILGPYRPGQMRHAGLGIGNALVVIESALQSAGEL